MLREKENRNSRIKCIHFWWCIPLSAAISLHIMHNITPENLAFGELHWLHVPVRLHRENMCMLPISCVKQKCARYQLIKMFDSVCSIASFFPPSLWVIETSSCRFLGTVDTSFHTFLPLTAHPTRKPLFPLLSAYLTHSLFCPVPSQPIPKQS